MSYGTYAHGHFTNRAHHTLSGGVAFLGARGTLTNYGSIAAGTGSGVYLSHGGLVTNAEGATISGSAYGAVRVVGAEGTVSNSGMIKGSVAGISIDHGGVIANHAGGSVYGFYEGIQAAGDRSTITNGGSVSGYYHGIALYGSGRITNVAGGYVHSTSAGGFSFRTDAILIEGASGTVVNGGTARDASAGSTYGIRLFVPEHGSVTNLAGGLVEGGLNGVLITGAHGQVANGGTILADDANGAAVLVRQGGDVTNTGSIGAVGAQGIGVRLPHGGAVFNSGTISGGADAVRFGAGTPSHLVIDPGALFIGNVVGGGVGGQIELAAGAQNGTIGGLGSQFTGFGVLVVDTKADWQATGANTFAGRVLDNGVLAVGSGTLTVTGSVAGVGTVQIGAGTALYVSGAVTAPRLSFLGNNGTASLGLPTRMTSVIAGFQSGDLVDLRNFHASSSHFAANTLSLTSAGGLATLHFAPGMTAAHLAVGSDHHGGTEVRFV